MKSSNGAQRLFTTREDMLLTRMAKGEGDMDARPVGRRLRLTRIALDLGQREFAARAGIAGNTYNQYEQGARLIPPGRATALCETYNLSLDWIYRGEPGDLPYKLAAAIKALSDLNDHN